MRPSLPRIAATISWLFIPAPSLFKVGPFLISLDLIASQLLFESANCIPLSPQSVSSHFISFHLMSCLVFHPPHLISSHLISSHLIISHHISSYLIISHLISSPLISGLLCLSQLFSADHNSLMSSELSHLFSAHLNSSLSDLLSFSILRSLFQLS